MLQRAALYVGEIFSRIMCRSGISGFYNEHLYFDEMLINWSVLPANYHFLTMAACGSFSCLASSSALTLERWRMENENLHFPYGWRGKSSFCHLNVSTSTPCPFSYCIIYLNYFKDYEFLIQTLFPVVLVETAFNLSSHLFHSLEYLCCTEVYSCS